MSDTTLTVANGASNIVLAVEAGMDRLREKFAPRRPDEASCHACRGGLESDYVRLSQCDVEGNPIWLHIGPCLGQFASLRRRTAESRLRPDGAPEC